MPVVIAENPLNCVVKGTEKTLGDIEKLKSILANSRKNRQEEIREQKKNRFNWCGGNSNYFDNFSFFI